MKNFRFLSFVSGAFLLFACTDEGELQLPVSSGDKAQENVSNYVALEEALQTADDVFAQMFPAEVQKRGGTKRKVANVSIVENRKIVQVKNLSGGDLSTSLYLVNYADGGGFALISSDRRLRPLYAISDEGALEMADTVGNPALKMFFQGIQSDMQTMANAAPNIVTNNPQHPGRKIVVNAQANPVLWQKVRRWHQGAPYNAYCENGTFVGCSALAIAQIFSVQSWPTSYDGNRLIWRSMKNGLNVDMLAKLLKHLGTSDLLDIDYGVAASGAMPGNFRRTFMAMGYQDPGVFHLFADEEVRGILEGNYLDGKGPVLTLGWTGAHATGTGHVWVIDGYARFEDETVAKANGMKSNTTLFHCVWGQENGKSNGYYYWGNDKSFDGSASYDVNDNCDGIVFGEDFTHNIVYMTNFKKQR